MSLNGENPPGIVPDQPVPGNPPIVLEPAVAEPPKDAGKSEPESKPAEDPYAEMNALMDKDLERYQAIKQQLGGDDGAVLKFLKARDSFGKARSEALIAAAAEGAEGKKKDKESSPSVAKEHAAAKDMLDKMKLDLGIADRSGKETKAPAIPAGFGAQYLSTDPWVVDTKSDLDNPTDLTADQWQKIFHINKALYGFTIRERECDVVNARYPAFIMRNPDSSEVNVSPPAKKGHSAPAQYLPEFEVVDASSISITEITSDLQSSLAQNGFSASAIQLSVSGGAFGVSAGISTGLNKQTSTGLGRTRDDSEKQYFATYNFPRARVFMDELNLEVSPQCSQALGDLAAMADTPLKPGETQDNRNKKAEEALVRFQKHFGHVFATQFSLGGQLQSTKAATAIFSASETDKTDALKGAVAASFSSTFVSGSGKYEYETQDHDNNKETKSSELSKLAWTARGGDTRLCANPPAWAATVECVVPLHELIGRCKGWEGMPAKLEQIAQLSLHNSPGGDGNKVWNNRIRLEPVRDDIKKLVYDRANTDVLVFSKDNNTQLEECVFTVLNANINEKSPEIPGLYLPSLYEQFPLFLTARESPSRNSKRGDQISGLWVNNAGQLRPEDLIDPEKTSPIMRWSFRKELKMGVWQSTDPHPVINDGDVVYLFCHSMILGVFRDPNVPPSVGSPVCWSQANPTQIKAFSPSKNWTCSEAYDENRLGDGILQVDTITRLISNLVAKEAADKTIPGAEAWLGAANPLLDPKMAKSLEDEDPASLKAVGDVLQNNAGMGAESDMLHRMYLEGFQPAKFTVRFM